MTNKESVKKYQNSNREEINRRAREKYHNNKLEIKEKHRKRYKENCELYRERARKNYNKEKRKARYLKNKERDLKQIKIWRNKNRDRYRKYQKEWTKNERKTNPQYSIAQRLRSRVTSALKAQNIKKSTTLHELIGCSLSELKIYIENLFSENMTWEAYLKGEIQLDHIKPCCSFDLTKEEEQKKCFHYSNLKPLWKFENQKKISQDKVLSINTL